MRSLIVKLIQILLSLYLPKFWKHEYLMAILHYKLVTLPHLLVTACHFRWPHDDVIKWKHFPRYWPFVRGIHRSPVTSPHKGQWRGALMFSLIYVWINVWVNNREPGDLGRYRAHYDVTVMLCHFRWHWGVQNMIYDVEINAIYSVSVRL